LYVLCRSTNASEIPGEIPGENHFCQNSEWLLLLFFFRASAIPGKKPRKLSSVQHLLTSPVCSHSNSPGSRLKPPVLSKLGFTVPHHLQRQLIFNRSSGQVVLYLLPIRKKAGFEVLKVTGLCFRKAPHQ